MPADSPQLWLADVVSAFRALEEEPGGIVWLQNVYDWITQHRAQRPKNFAAVIRATIYHHSSDSEAFLPGYPNVFRKVAHGGWALRQPDAPVPAKSSDLMVFVLSQMTTEELTAFAGRGNEFLFEVDRRVDQLKRRFDMG